MARRRYEVPIKKNSTFGLNITSMTDMFTILLVFLLQSYSTSEVELTQTQGLRLPSSASFVSPTQGLQISLSSKELKVGEKSVANLQGTSFNNVDLESSDPNFIKPLFDELDKIAKDENNKDKPHIKDGKILFQADRTLPYSTLKKVMYTASMAGFPQLKLVTILGE